MSLLKIVQGARRPIQHDTVTFTITVTVTDTVIHKAIL